MRALTIERPGEYRLANRPRPAVASDEVLMAPLAVGLCGTDLELLDGTMAYIRSGRATLPMVPGHEWVARVVDIGSDVVGFASGDLVVGECSIGCGHCDLCLAGDYNQCGDRRETGVMNLDGAFAGYLVLPASSVHPVPDAVDVEDAVFTEPTAIALRAVLRSSCGEGERVMVTGGGAIGWLIAAILIELYGADVAVAEPEASRMARLTELGARAARPGETFPIVFEASGSAYGVADSFGNLANGGRLVVVGLNGLGALPIDLDRVVINDQTIVGSLGSPGVWPQALELLSSGRVHPALLVSDRFPLSEFDDAIDRMRAHSSGKILILPDDSDRDQPTDFHLHRTINDEKGTT
ncbi:zinc-dependent alcohol dehydrogenase [Planctomonas psychrotolerans]|uniref:zinc-dependent alcohol dehydrogenase n=1 Tax=Planctomonas psychrotolerans TaxID=2528712 RepID=UPI00123B2742|nr:alcohol dehydrogenase catalytic domain-containing protein [Planctomonas psychrotolerans]